MLNISRNTSVKNEVKRLNYDSLTYVEKKTSGKILKKMVISMGVFALIMMFVPWTQNIKAKGKLITLNPEERPQTINSTIGGTVNKWFVKEGDLVSKGDTIIFLKEVKSDYLDPNLVANTTKQKEIKLTSIDTYQMKVDALTDQLNSLTVERDLKYDQALIKYKQVKLKVQSDSIAAAVAATNLITYKDQFDRFQELFDDGLKSQTDLENREIKYQNAVSYNIEANNKLLASQSELINTKVSLQTVKTKYQASIAKTQSDISSALSLKLDAEVAYQKLDNQLNNYSIRNDMYYVLAPQDGYVTELFVQGVGEVLKAGDPIITITPDKYEFAAEIYVDPIDLPLLSEGQDVRIQFDGWPAVVFSGWPGSSFGTFGGEIYAIDKFINKNGQYRVLVEPSKDGNAWPKELRFGSGANSFIMLNDVPIWYELWRNINGFPPDFYKNQASIEDQNTKK